MTTVCLSEIVGFRTFQSKILLQILNSKRLLIDHVEVLEECLNSVVQSTEYSRFTTFKLLLLSSIAGTSMLLLRHQDWRWILPFYGTTAAYGICCSLKLANRIYFRGQEKLLAQLIRALEQFDLAVKKNVLFLNESQHIRSVQMSLDKARASTETLATNCIQCCVETIKMIHSFITRLEIESPLRDQWDALYSPIEALEDCELFSEEISVKVADPKAIKNFYNIFAYVQSQYLTRLALSVASGYSNLSRYRLPELIQNINHQKDQCVKHLHRILESNRERIPRVSTSTLPSEVANLRTMSLTLSAKLLNTVHQYSHLEHAMEASVQNYEENHFQSQLEQQEASLQEIANELVASGEELQRLLISIRKCLNKEAKPPLEVDMQLQENAEQKADEVPSSSERVYSEQDVPVFKDEFFAIDGTDRESDEEGRCSVDDLDSINSKIVKRHFKPVLAQLRERIVPIGVDFKEREKRALRDKGICLDDLEDDARSDDERAVVVKTFYSSDSDDEEDERNARKFQRSLHRYDEDRGFLAAKEQLNLFGLKPVTSVLSEDVLE